MDPSGRRHGTSRVPRAVGLANDALSALTGRVAGGAKATGTLAPPSHSHRQLFPLVGPPGQTRTRDGEGTAGSHGGLLCAPRPSVSDTRCLQLWIFGVFSAVRGPLARDSQGGRDPGVRKGGTVCRGGPAWSPGLFPTVSEAPPGSGCGEDTGFSPTCLSPHLGAPTPQKGLLSRPEAILRFLGAGDSGQMLGVRSWGPPDLSRGPSPVRPECCAHPSPRRPASPRLGHWTPSSFCAP